jgi:YVTN family beta-propeller protein
LICDSTSSNWNYYHINSYDNWWNNTLFTGITPNFTLNANGLNVNVIPDSLSSLIAFYAQAEVRDTNIDSSEFGTKEKNFGFDKVFVYTSLNNNRQVTLTTTPSSAPPLLCEVTVDTITGLGNAPFGIAYDSIKERIYVTNSDDNTVSVINITTNTVIDTISIGVVPYGIEYDNVIQRMYVTNFGDGTVSVIDMTTNTVVGGPIKVGDGPRGIAYDLVSDRMYVANSLDETVSVINFC